MPIEIRELIIKTVVEDKEISLQKNKFDFSRMKREIVNECMEKINEIIQEEKER